VLALARHHAERLLDVVPARGARGGELLLNGGHVLHLEADVVDALEAGANRAGIVDRSFIPNTSM
jgi:hypothetical protein